jgi:dihydrofolate synthase/folylpolyglutamate synthase
MSNSRFATLDEWLAWQERLHPREIDLGLDRVHQVAEAMDRLVPSFPVITVAGTNGKGSSVTMLESVLVRGGYRVGSYTSPHLLRYNERVRLQAQPVTDAALVGAFARIDQARGETSLSYFEFGTLAAMDIFWREAPDVVVLEVGLGGRLDAVNLWDAQVALVTAVDLDHMRWLGPDRESIGREKAGVFRPGRPAVCSDPNPPRSLRERARELGASWFTLGEDFGCEASGPDRWRWWSRGGTLEDLPLPGLSGEHQLQNAAGVLMVLDRLRGLLPLPEGALAAGLAGAHLSGRQQWLPGSVEQVLDVSHNAHGGQALAAALRRRPLAGVTRVVLAMLADKDPAAFSATLAPLTDHWYLAGLDGPRGLSGEALASQIREAEPQGAIEVYGSVHEAYRAAVRAARPGDRVVVCGSFRTVAAVAEQLTR